MHPVNNNTARYARCHPTGRVSIGLGAVWLLDVNHDYELYILIDVNDFNQALSSATFGLYC